MPDENYDSKNFKKIKTQILKLVIQKSSQFFSLIHQLIGSLNHLWSMKHQRLLSVKVSFKYLIKFYIETSLTSKYDDILILNLMAV